MRGKEGSGAPAWKRKGCMGMGDGGCAEEERGAKGGVTDAVGKLPVRLSFRLVTVLVLIRCRRGVIIHVTRRVNPST
jgi:hypothetical protein